MLKRTLSALIGAPMFLGLIYLGGPYIAFLVAVLTLLALREFFKNWRANGCACLVYPNYAGYSCLVD